MVTSFLKRIKNPFFPLWGGVTCAFLSVDNFIKFLFGVANTISEYFLILQITKYPFVNKAFGVVANLLKPLNPRFYVGFFISRFNNLLILT